jgi:hypothetical protein
MVIDYIERRWGTTARAGTELSNDAGAYSRSA